MNSIFARGAGAFLAPAEPATTMTVEIAMPDEEKTSSDVSRLTFPLQLVITLVSIVITTVITILGATYTMRSDVRDIATRQELRDKHYQEASAESALAVSDLKKEVRMFQERLTEIQISLAESGILKRGK